MKKSARGQRKWTAKLADQSPFRAATTDRPFVRAQTPRSSRRRRSRWRRMRDDSCWSNTIRQSSTAEAPAAITRSAGVGFAALQALPKPFGNVGDRPSCHLGSKEARKEGLGVQVIAAERSNQTRTRLRLVIPNVIAATYGKAPPLARPNRRGLAAAKS